MKLVERGVSLARTVLKQGQFVVVFPEAFTASVSCGYNVSESIHYATQDWILLGCKASQVTAMCAFYVTSLKSGVKAFS